MSTFLEIIEILGWGAAGVLAVLLVAPWHFRGAARIGPVLQWELSVAWAFGVVRVGIGAGNIRLERHNGSSGATRADGPEPALVVHVAGIRVWDRRLAFGRTSAKIRKDRFRLRRKSHPDDKTACPDRDSRPRQHEARNRRRNRSGEEFLQRSFRFPIRTGWETALLVLRRLARTLRLKVSARGTYAAPDPAVTGWLAAFIESIQSATASGPPGTGKGEGTRGRRRQVYTAANKAKYPVLDLHVQPDFATSYPDLVTSVEARAVPAAVLIAVLSLLRRKQVRDLLAAFRKTTRTTKTTKEAHTHA